MRYAIATTPEVFYLCHCRECQRQSSSAFGQSLRVAAQGFSLTGDTAAVTWTSDAGTVRRGTFCPACGTRLFHDRTGAATINVKAGTLDDPSWLEPAGHVWLRSKQAFFEVPPGALAYATQPPDAFAALKTRWREMIAAG